MNKLYQIITTTTLGLLLTLSLIGADHDCRDYTFDSCQYDSGTIVDTIKDVNEDQCQLICSAIYPERCQMFIYNRPELVCTLLGQEVKSYVDTCTKIGGPTTPTVEDCTSEADRNPCTNIREEYCIYQGQLLENLNQIPNYKVKTVSLS